MYQKKKARELLHCLYWHFVYRLVGEVLLSALDAGSPIMAAAAHSKVALGTAAVLCAIAAAPSTAGCAVRPGAPALCPHQARINPDTVAVAAEAWPTRRTRDSVITVL